MNQKQFRAALLRGQGRCVLAVQKDPARYARQVLWACGHPIAFDPQCEGSRAFYTCDMIRCYENRQPFLNAACAALARTKPDGGWEIFCFSELLAHFARDGEPAAETALWQKYAEMYAALAARRRLLPEPLLQECLWDANDGLRRDAARRLRRRAGRKQPQKREEFRA